MSRSAAINRGKDAMRNLPSQGQQVLSMLERHFERLATNEIPCMLDMKPGDVAKKVPDVAPIQPRKFDDIMQDVEMVLFPGLTHWQHPRFMAYYPSNTSVPAILSELLISGSGVVGLQWAASPAATELEVCVMDWLAKMIGVGGPFLHTSGLGGGLIQNTAGEAIASVFVCARCALHRRLLFNDETGDKELTKEQRDETFYADSSKFVVYMSDETHFSGEKAVRVAGMRCVQLPARLGVDRHGEKTYGLQVEDLRQRIAEDKAKGLIPCAVQLNYGTTNTSSRDPIADYEQLVSDEKLWLHVDAAYAGPSWILPQFQYRTKDVERVATSFNFNGSKWFLCGFDSAFLWVKNRKMLKHVFAATGAYLAPNEYDGTYNPEFKDWAVPLGRRFRSLRVWMVLNYYGVSGIQGHLHDAIEQGNKLRQLLADNDDLFEQPVTTELGLVVFKLCAGDAATQLVAERLLEGNPGDNDGFCVYPSVFQGNKVIRVALGGVLTDDHDIDTLWDRVLLLSKEITKAEK